MLHLTLRELAAKKLRLMTTAIAVMLGVAFMAGTLVLTATISKTFEGLFTDGYAGTDAYVRGTSEINGEFGAQRPRIDASMVSPLPTPPQPMTATESPRLRPRSPDTHSSSTPTASRLGTPGKGLRRSAKAG